MYPSLSRYFVPPLLLNVFASVFSQEKGNRSHVMALRINRHPNRLRGCRNFRTPYLCVCVCVFWASWVFGRPLCLCAAVVPVGERQRPPSPFHCKAAQLFRRLLEQQKVFPIASLSYIRKKAFLWVRTISFGRYPMSEVGVQKLLYC